MTHPLQQLFSGERPLIMGIVNVTPDSFSDGGRLANAAEATAYARGLEQAHIIDIGGESTGPGRLPIEASEEIRRISGVINALAGERFLSIDTYKAKTAAYCLERGAQMINDVSALRADPALAEVVREHQAFLVLMYSKEADNHPHATKLEREYQDVVGEIGDFLSRRVDFALSSGIAQDRIILDPGMGGFVSPKADYSWRVLQELPRLKERFSGFPFLLGTSRKGFLGKSVDSRDPLSQVTGLAAVLNGAQIIRTHDVEMMDDFLRAWELIRPQDLLFPRA